MWASKEHKETTEERLGHWVRSSNYYSNVWRSLCQTVCCWANPKESEQLLGVGWEQLNMPHDWPLIFRVLASSLNKNVLLPGIIIMIINTYYFSSLSLAYWYAVAHLMFLKPLWNRYDIIYIWYLTSVMTLFRIMWLVPVHAQCKWQSLESFLSQRSLQDFYGWLHRLCPTPQHKF